MSCTVIPVHEYLRPKTINSLLPFLFELMLNAEPPGHLISLFAH